MVLEQYFIGISFYANLYLGILFVLYQLLTLFTNIVLNDNSMDQNITMLCDVDPMLDDLKVVARCISKWVSHPVGNPSDVWSLDFVFQDTQVLKTVHVVF